MKHAYRILLAFAVLDPAPQVPGQGTFQNLDFEAANIQQNQSPGPVNTIDALPGWTALIGTDAQSQIYYNSPSLGSTWISLLGSNGPGFRSIEGGFSLLLQGGLVLTPAGFVPMDASISQVGLVPSTSQSIIFKAQSGTPEGKFLSLAGQNIPIEVMSSTADYTLYGGNVSSFAGQTVELRFTSTYVSSGNPNNWNLDSIQFSDMAVPEPNAAALVVLGAILIGFRSIRARGEIC